MWQFCTLLFIACLISFFWGMRRFFRQPSGETAGMRVTKYAGMVAAAIQLGVLITRHTPVPELAVAAVVLYLCSLLLFWWAVNTNQKQPLSAVFSTDLPVHLVQDGPYRWIRHPFYTSYLLAWAAGVLATAELWLSGTFLIMAAIYLKAAQAEEEKFFRTELAADYRRYRMHSGLFLPKLPEEEIPNPLKASAPKPIPESSDRRRAMMPPTTTVAHAPRLAQKES